MSEYTGPQKEFLASVLESEPILFGRGPTASIEPRLIWKYQLPGGELVAPPGIENAVVYRVGNRRFLTKKAAVRAYAWQRIKARYKCECEPDVGYDCGKHEYIEALFRRYAKFLTPRLFKAQ